MKYLFMDLETPNRKNNSICSISLISLENGNESNVINYLVNPDDKFDDKNMSIHKITPLMVKDKRTFDKIWEEIKLFFNDHIIVGHNIVFDLSVLCKTLYNYKIDIPKIKCIDTLEISHALIHDIESFDLVSLCKHFNIYSGTHHNSNDDVNNCKKLYTALLNTYKFNPNDFEKVYLFKESPCSESNLSNNFTDSTLQMRILKKLAEKIISDNEVSPEEILSLNSWMQNNEHLTGNYPFDKIYSMCKDILSDGIIETTEQEDLLKLLNDFVNPVENQDKCCLIDFNEKTFCLTGTFMSGSKSDITNRIQNKGGIISASVTKKTDYLIVGGVGSDSWKFGNYGAKVSKALKMQDDGSNIQIIKELDLINCLK